MSVIFQGIPWDVGLGLALFASGIAGLLYFRETNGRAGRYRLLLPGLRAVSVFLIVFSLTEPVIRQEKVVRKLAHVVILIDQSQSMDVDDAEMSFPRKFLLMERLGLLAEHPASERLQDAGAELSLAAAMAQAAARGGAEFSLAVSRLEMASRHLENAIRFLEPTSVAIRSVDASVIAPSTVQDSWPDNGENFSHLGEHARLKAFAAQTRDLLDQARGPRGIGYAEFREELTRTSHLVTEWREWLRFQEQVEASARWARRRNEPSFLAAAEQFDQMKRHQRLERLLFDEKTGFVPRLADNYRIQVGLVHIGKTTFLTPKLFGKERKAGLIRLPRDGFGTQTDLSTPLRETAGTNGENAAVIVFSDGRHNDGPPLQIAADSLQRHGVKLIAVGVGALHDPEDMAIVGLNAPESVHYRDRVRGEILLHDTMPPGIPYRASIALDAKILWAKSFDSDQSGRRVIPFDFGLAEAAEKFLALDEEETRRESLSFFLTVNVEQADGSQPPRGEKFPTNNAAALAIQTKLRTWQALIIDEMPREDLRHFAKAFEQDPRWEVKMALPPGAPRGNGIGDDARIAWPATRDAWMALDLIVLGEFSPEFLRADERQWIAEFVSLRGGGLVLLDGDRGQLRELMKMASWDELWPVHYLEDSDFECQRVLPSDGERASGWLPWLNSLDASQQALIVPRKPIPTRAKPSAQVLLEARRDDQTVIPLLVSSQVGAGRVLYSATDEFWRWRAAVGPQRCEQFWTKLADSVGTPAMLIETAEFALAVDHGVYRSGDSAEWTLFLRTDQSAEVQPREWAVAIYRFDGTLLAEVAMSADPAIPGVLRGKSLDLPPGRWMLAVRRKPGDAASEFGPRAQLAVIPQKTFETGRVSLDRVGWEQFASAAGGHFLLEEEVTQQLPRILERLDQKETITRETVIWSSYWWLIPIMLFLTMEWSLRKRAGLI